MDLPAVPLATVLAGLSVLIALLSCVFSWQSKNAAETSAWSSVESASAARQSAAVARATVEITFEVEPIMTELVIENSELAGLRLTNTGANVFVHSATLEQVDVENLSGHLAPGWDEVGLNLGKEMTLNDFSPDAYSVKTNPFPTYLHRGERVDLYVDGTDPRLVGYPLVSCVASIYYTFDGQGEPLQRLVKWHQKFALGAGQ